MSSGDQSVLIISQLCHKCHQNIDEYTDEQSCSHCGTPFAEKGSVSPAMTPLLQTASTQTSPKVIPEGDKSLSLCAICLDHLNGHMSELGLKCGHWFHSRCIGKWLTTHLTCPVCRAPTIDVAINRSQVFRAREMYITVNVGVGAQVRRHNRTQPALRQRFNQFF